MGIKQISALPAAGALSGSELVEVSHTSATVTITATTISAQASDNSFNDTGLGFTAAGFAVGNRVGVAGFTGDTANNLFVGVVTALTDGKMTIGGSDGDVIVDDAAGESVTISKWESRRTTSQDIADLGGGGSNIFDPACFYPGVPANSALLLYVPITRATTFAANFAGSYAKATVAATAETVFDIQKNGVSVGSITFAASGTSGTFVSSGGTEVSFAAGDVLSIVGPATADATLANIGIAMAGAR